MCNHKKEEPGARKGELTCHCIYLRLISTPGGDYMLAVSSHFKYIVLSEHLLGKTNNVFNFPIGNNFVSFYIFLGGISWCVKSQYNYIFQKN